MNKHVFIIPEPHIWDKNFKNRVSYPQEIYGYLDRVVSIVKTYEGEDITIIFPGDVFHRTFTSIGGLIKAFNFFATLNNLSNSNVYSCVGNHELSYPFNNPFWMLAKDKTSRFGSMRGLEAYGSISKGLTVVDDLTIGNLKFIFGHYNRQDLADESDKDLVLITHNSIIEAEICSYLQNTMGRAANAEYMHTTSLRSKEALPLSERLKYVFVGHMHTFYSSFTVEENICGVPMNFQLQYLGSLGRTAVNEVNDSDLERTIPHFVISEDGTYTYDGISIELQPRASVVVEEIVTEQHEAYSREKAVKQLKESNVFGDSAYDAIVNNLQSFPLNLGLFRELYTNEIDPSIRELIQEAYTL